MARHRRHNPHELNRLQYAYEKLSAAVYVLATDPYDVKVRLRGAWEPFVLTDKEALPPRLKRDYEQIFAALTRNPPTPWPYRKEGALNATLHGMHLTTSARIAARIVQLEGELGWYLRDLIAPPRPPFRGRGPTVIVGVKDADVSIGRRKTRKR